MGARRAVFCLRGGGNLIALCVVEAQNLTDEQDRELDRRLALMDADPTALRPRAEVEARVLGKLQG